MNLGLVMKNYVIIMKTALPEHSEDKNSRYKGDEGGSVAGSVHLFEVGEVCCLKCKKEKRIKEFCHSYNSLSYSLHVFIMC